MFEVLVEFELVEFLFLESFEGVLDGMPGFQFLEFLEL